MSRLATVERNRIFRRNERAGEVRCALEEVLQSGAVERRDGKRTFRSGCSLGQIRPGVNPHETRMIGRIRRFAKPEEHIRGLDQRPRSIDSDPLDGFIRLAQARCVRKQDWNAAQRKRSTTSFAVEGATIR